MNPKISVITATYNAGKTIEQTIVSVLGQEYDNLEYIIIDGASTDNTMDIVKSYKNDLRLKYISEPDNGLYDALNKGVKLASGDYVEILGADDCFISSRVVSLVVNELAHDTDIYSGLEYAVEEESKYQCTIGDNHIARNKNKYKGGMIAHAAMFVRRELLLKYGFDTTYKIAADYKFFLQCYYDDEVKFQFSDLYIAFFSLSGISSTGNLECRNEDERIYRELGLDIVDPVLNHNSLKLKKVLCRLKILNAAKMICRVFSKKWEKHFCNNEICRWCGRV